VNSQNDTKKKLECNRNESERRYLAEHPDYPDSIFTIYIPTDEKAGIGKVQVYFKPVSI